MDILNCIGLSVGDRVRVRLVSSIESLFRLYTGGVTAPTEHDLLSSTLSNDLREFRDTRILRATSFKQLGFCHIYTSNINTTFHIISNGAIERVRDREQQKKSMPILRRRNNV